MAGIRVAVAFEQFAQGICKFADRWWTKIGQDIEKVSTNLTALAPWRTGQSLVMSNERETVAVLSIVKIYCLTNCIECDAISHLMAFMDTEDADKAHSELFVALSRDRKDLSN